MLYQLRRAGISGEKDYTGRKMKTQFKSADRLRARYAAILGEDELLRGEINLKSLDTGEQITIKLENLVTELKNRIKGIEA